MYEPTYEQNERADRLALRHGGVRIDASPVRIDGEYRLCMVDPGGAEHWVAENGEVREISGPTNYELVPPTYPRDDADGDGTGRK